VAWNDRRPAVLGLRLGHALALAAIGAGTAWLGALLLGAGGSAYFAVLGVLLLVTALLVARRDSRSAGLFALILAATLAWSLAEAGLDPLVLAPRLGLLTALGVPLLAIARFRRWLAGAIGAIAVTMLIACLVPQRELSATPPGSLAPVATQAFAGADWSSWGGDAGGARFSTLRQIDPGNVARLVPAWTYRTGASGGALPLTFEATPLAVGGRLFVCTGEDDVIALDGETGRPLWRFAAHLDHRHLPGRGL